MNVAVDIARAGELDRVKDSEDKKTYDHELPHGQRRIRRQIPEDRHAKRAHNFVQHEVPRIGIVPPLLRPRREPVVDGGKKDRAREAPQARREIAPSESYGQQNPRQPRKRAERSRHDWREPQEEPACEEKPSSVFHVHGR